MVQVGRLKLSIVADSGDAPLIHWVRRAPLNGTSPAPGLSQNQARKLIETGKVYVGRELAADWRAVVPAQALVTVDTDRRKPQRIPSFDGTRIIYNDAALVVVNKPAGVVSVPPTRTGETTLLDLLCRTLGTVIAVHRLDRETSGLMLFAASKEAASILLDRFKSHSIERAYYAVVEGHPEPGLVEGRIDVTRTEYSSQRQTRHAVTRIEVVRRTGPLSLLTCTPGTGRYHQLRIVLSGLGTPIVGEKAHLPEGFKPAFQLPRLALQSFAMSLRHPLTDQPMHWELPLDPELEAILSPPSS